MPVSCHPHLLVSQCDAKFSTNRRLLPPKHPMMPNQPTSDRKRFPSPFTPKRRRQLCCHFKRSSFTASSITSVGAVCWGGIPADCLCHSTTPNANPTPTQSKPFARRRRRRRPRVDEMRKRFILFLFPFPFPTRHSRSSGEHCSVTVGN